MGGDGGSIPTRDELVKVKKAPEKKNRDQDMVGKWQHCALSGHALTKPIMSCGLGRLYNKEAVINLLLDKTIKSHIKKLSDVVELKLTDNIAYNNEIKADSYIDHYSAPYVCPVIGLEMSGRYRYQSLYARFIFNWECGCAVSERATIEVPSQTCHKCGIAIDKENNVIINGNEEDCKLMAVQIKKRKERSKLEKRRKNELAKTEKSAVEEDKPSKNKRPQESDSSYQGKKSKVAQDSLSDKTGSSSDNKFKETNSYKKLFHKNSDKKDKAHWVTYNPYYN